MRFEAVQENNEPKSVNAVQIYNVPQTKEEIMKRHYETTQQNTALQKKNWTKIVQFNKEICDVQGSFPEHEEKIRVHVRR